MYRVNHLIKEFMSNKVVRIKDIAERAGVSTGTVDRVLHDRGRVSQDVKEKVLKIIKEMDYEPMEMGSYEAVFTRYRIQ